MRTPSTQAVVTGAGGQLGRALRTALPHARFLTSADLDITDRAAVAGLDWSGATAIVNAAAWTSVDAAEEPGDALRAWDVNATGVANLARQARQLDVPLVQVSSDYVFRGDGREPVPVDAPLDPRGGYAVSKAAGELAARLAPRHYVVRTSWVFGDGANFVRTMRRLAAERDEVTVVDDQFGRPTYAVDLAGALVALLDAGCPPGTYHATGSGDVVSWADFAEAIVEGTGCRVRRVSTESYLRAATSRPAGPGSAGTAVAPRPAYSALDLSSIDAVGVAMRDWRTALAEYLASDGLAVNDPTEGSR